MSDIIFDTPCICIDLATLDANIAAGMQLWARAGASVRPHLKTGKCPEVAQRLIAAGARGICVAKLGEAEVMVAAGITDVMITTELVGAPKLARLTRLLAQAPRLRGVVDGMLAARALNAALATSGQTFDVLIDVNVAQNRTGVLPGDAVALARELQALPHLNLIGVQGYEGNLQHIVETDTRRAANDIAMDKLAQAVSALRANGFAVPVVSTGGTGTSALCLQHPHVTEVQPGSFIFMDADYGRVQSLPFRQALHVVTSVISMHADGRIVIDAGLKSLSTDSGNAVPADVPGWAYRPAGDEHGLLEPISGVQQVPLHVGQQLRMIPSHIDTTVNLFDQFHLLQRDEIIGAWRIAGRGKVT